MKSPLLNRIFLSAFSLAVILFINGCDKGNSSLTPATVPVLTTNGLIVNLTSTGAQSGGIITNNGGADVITSGVCYSSSNQTPTTGDPKTNDARTIDPAGTTSFTSTITGLIASTTYYLRAYASNSAGIAYGNVVKFTTSGSVTSVTSTVTTLAGSVGGGYMEGTGTGALFSNPQSVVTDAQGNVYVADGFNNRIREVTPAGVVTTFAGDGNAGFSNGPAATAEFYAPQGLAIDAQGNIYVADIGNNVIRKISGGVVTTFAGNGLRGYVNGAGTVAEFNNPQGLAVDASGNVFVADRDNQAIRKITSAGVVSLLAGSGVPYFFDGTGTNSAFNSPSGVAVDTKGNVYVADLNNYCIRKVTQGGVVTTVAGGVVQTTLIGSPTGIGSDTKGNIYITDEGGRILEITTGSTTDVLYVLAGSANTTGYVDGTGLQAKFNNPQGVAVDTQGNVYVADYNNNVIRKIVVTFN